MSEARSVYLPSDYTIETADDAAPSHSRANWRPRFVSGGGGDRVVLRGATVELSPGRRRARVVRRAGVDAASPEVAEALETALMHAAALQGVALLHAAAFEVAGLSVLAIGASCSGKSTLAAAALNLGGRLVSDDSVLLGLDETGALRASTVCRDLRLRGASVSVVPEAVRALLARSREPNGERWLLRRDAAPRRFTASLTPTVVLRVRLDRRRQQCQARTLTASELLATLIGSASPLFLSARYPEERDRLSPLLASAADRMHGFDVRIGRALLTEPGATLQRLVNAARDLDGWGEKERSPGWSSPAHRNRSAER